MGFNENWNESSKTLEQEQKLNRQKESENEEIHHIIDRFRQDYQCFFRREKVYPQATQTFQHMMRLVRQRLERHSLTLEVSFEGLKTDRTKITWTDDGRGLAANVQEEVHTTRTYKKENKAAGVFKNKEIAEYVLVETPVTGHEIRCPNCGNVLTKAENNYTCIYCDSAFLQRDFNKHVTAFRCKESYEVAIKRIRKLGNLLMLKIPVAAYILTYLIGYLLFNLTGDSPSVSRNNAELISSVMGTLITFVSVTVGLCITLPRGVYRKVLNAKHVYARYALNIPFENRVKNFDSNFSLENFESMLQNRLMMLHCAHRPQEVSSFVKCDIKDCLRNYDDIVDCVLQRVQYHGFHADSQYQRIDLTAHMLLYRYDGETVRVKKEKAGMSLLKSSNARFEKAEDAVLFTCSSCGHNLDLMKGSVCEACGKELNLVQYDWVTVSYNPGRSMTGMVRSSGSEQEKKLNSLNILSQLLSTKVTSFPAVIAAAFVIISAFLPFASIGRFSRSLIHDGEGWTFLFFAAIYLTFIFLGKNLLAFSTSLILIVAALFEGFIAYGSMHKAFGFYLLLASVLGTAICIPVMTVMKKKASSRYTRGWL